VLAFDSDMRSLKFVFVVLFISGLNILAGLIRMDKGEAGGIWHTLIASSVTCFLVIALIVAAAARIRALRRVFARCVVVPARVLSVQIEKSVSVKGAQSEDLRLTIEYIYAGARREASPQHEPPVSGLIGATPALLVDTANPNQVYLRDLYI
jgi:hypothetical protein